MTVGKQMEDLARYRRNTSHGAAVVAVRYHRVTGRLVSADGDGGIMIWEGKRAREVRSPHSTLTGVWFDEHRGRLMAGHQGGRLVIFDLEQARAISDVLLKPSTSPPRMIGARPVLDWVIHVTCSSEADDLYTMLESGELIRVRQRDLGPEPPVALGRNLYDCAAGSPDSRFVFLGDDLGYIDRIEIASARRDCFACHHEAVDTVDLSGGHSEKDWATNVLALAVSPDCSRVASASRYGGVLVWPADYRPPTGPGVDPFNRQSLSGRGPIRNAWMRGLCFRPNSNQLALGDDSGTLELWDYVSGETSHRGRCSSSVQSLDVSPDGGELAFGCEDGGVYVLPLSEGSASARKGGIARLFRRS